jgi:FKBP-type peptidyl-prolyl cis-trans isomerase
MHAHRAFRLITIGVLIAGVFAVACTKKESGKIQFKTANEKMSYIFGTQIGESIKNLKNNDYPVDIAMFNRGMKDVMDSVKLALSDSQMATAQEEFQTTMRTKQEEKMKKDMVENQAKASKFLAQNATKPGVITLPPDSLQYQIIKEGTGPQPKATDTVKLNYVGTFLDGKEFDSSRKPGGQPLQFSLSAPGMIQGFTEIIPMMKVGSTWKVFIPPKLAYGERGRQNIAPNTLLIFEIELLEAVKTPAENMPMAPKGKPSKK